MERNEKKIRKLREQADKARQSGNNRKAIDLYHELCHADPEEPRWPQLCGELHRKLGQLDDSVEHFVAAARIYKDQGFDVKAVAMCKVLLALDPLNSVGLNLLEEITAAPRIRPQTLQAPALTPTKRPAQGTPQASPDGRYPTPGPGAGYPVPMSDLDRAMAATGGAAVLSPPSREVPVVPGPAPRRATKETSPKEMQALNLSDLEALLQPPGSAPAAAPRVAAPPPQPAPTRAPAVPSPRATLDLDIEIEGFDAVLNAGPATPSGRAAATTPAAPTPLEQKKPGDTLTLNEDELELLEDDADEEDELVVVEPVRPRPTRPVAHQTLALSEDELEILDASDMAFMEALEKSSAGVQRQPKKRPTLQHNAPLESLELRDVMPRMERRPSQPHMEELYEIELYEPDSEPELAPAATPAPAPAPTATPAPGQPTAPGDYERRITPSKAPPDMTPPGLFRALGIDATKSLVTRMNFIEKKPGDIVIQQGEIGGSLYVIVRGEVRIVKELGDERVEVSRLGDGEFFGEMALVTDTPRVATVEAITELDLLEVSRDTLRLLIQDFPQVVPNLIKFLKDRLLEIFVKTSDLLRPVPEKYRWQLARKFKLYEIHEGRTILREGKPSGGMFIFLAGQASATRQRRGKTLLLADLGPGAVIGEISLLTGGSAVATVTAKTKCWLLAVSNKQFEVLCNSFPQMRNYVQELADHRREENAKILSGDGSFVSQELRMV